MAVLSAAGRAVDCSVARDAECRSQLAGDRLVWLFFVLFGEPDQERFDPAFGRPESLLFDSPKRSNQEKGDPTVARRSLRERRTLRCSEPGGRRELGHPWPRTSTPFPAGFLRYSARHTGFARHAAVATRSLRPAPGRHREVALGLRASALRGHDGRVTGPLAGRRAAGGSARRVARTMRAIFAPAHGGAAAKTRKPIADPEAGCRRALGWGALSLGYFSLGKQREVTRDARRAARKLLLWLLKGKNNRSKTTHPGRGQGPLLHQRLAHHTGHQIKDRGREQPRSNINHIAKPNRTKRRPLPPQQPLPS
jgi:hypothetical protein